MRRIVYSVAMSLDGYIAGRRGENDWIIMDPDIDFKSIWDRFDTLLMGRGTFEPTAAQGQGTTPGVKTYLFSTTLKQEDYPDVTVVADNVAETVAALKEEEGKDIWLFGGGVLFQSLLNQGLVDAVEVAVIPVLLGEGIPFLPSPATQTKLKLTGHRIYGKSGTVGLDYAVG